MNPSPLVATLVALTEEAQRALGGNGEVRITQFPFKVGRESRSPSPVRRLATELEKKRPGAVPELNDVYLIEPPSETFLLHISREHFAIECVDNQFFLVDRGSACGTIVAGKQVGGDRTGGRTELQNGDLVVVGTSSSPYVFQFEMVATVAATVDVVAASGESVYSSFQNRVVSAFRRTPTAG